jgi:hypothetical protein
MGQLPKLIRFGSLSDVRVREVSNELIIEATGQHRSVSDDTPRELSYVWFITLRDGQVTHFRDYMNPLQLSVTLKIPDQHRLHPSNSTPTHAANYRISITVSLRWRPYWRGEQAMTLLNAELKDFSDS